jgi:hypothetical protein
LIWEGVLESFETDQRDVVSHEPPPLLGRGSVEAEDQIALQVEPGEERGLLEDEDARAPGLPHGLAVHAHLAPVGLLEARQHAEQRRLAAARRADHGDELAVAHREADVVEDGERAAPRRERLGEAAHRDLRSHTASEPRRVVPAGA